MTRRQTLLLRLVSVLGGAAGCGDGGCALPMGTREEHVPTLPAKSPLPIEAWPSPSSTVATEQRALELCSPEHRTWPKTRTGGPYAQVRCYAPQPSTADCLATASPELMGALRAPDAQCMHRGPSRQSDAATGAPICCYVVGFMGEGRPLVVGGEPRVAGLRRRGDAFDCLALPWS